MSASPKNTPLTWILTAAVLLIGGQRALDAWTARQAAAPEPEPTPAPQTADEHPNVDLRTHAAPAGWTVTADADLSDLRELRWTNVREQRAGDSGEGMLFEGTLTLGFGPGLELRWPVVEGEVEATPDPVALARLAKSGVLTVAFGEHEVQQLDYSWLRPVAAPAFLVREAEPTRGYGEVRNPSLQPLRVRVRGGWKDKGRWLEKEGHAARTELDVPPGGSASFELHYSAGPASAELARPVVRALR